jgi:hypothetical protein
VLFRPTWWDVCVVAVIVVEVSKVSGIRKEVGRIEGASLLDSTSRRAELDDEMVKAAFDTRHLLRFVYVKCDGPL